MKKVAIIVSLFLLILSSVLPLNASAADDLTGHKYEDEVRELMSLGVIEGYKDGTIRPDKQVTRAEFAKMVVDSLEIGTAVEGANMAISAVTNVTFKDVAADAWYAEPISKAVEAGIVKGYPGELFKPGTLITREQMASMVSRALEAKGIVLNVSETKALSFKDMNDIRTDHKDDVRILTHLGIMNGNTDNTFRPKDQSTRWMVALVMLKARDVVFPPKDMPFQASSVTSDKTTVVKEFEDFNAAKRFVQDNSSAQVVESSNKVIWMESGIAVSNKLAYVFPTTELKWGTDVRGGQFRPYATTNTELKYIDATDQYVKVELAGVEGYVKSSDITLIPDQMKKGHSYYRVVSGNLEHLIFNHSTGTYASTGVIGKAPAGMSSGVNYYSWDGALFTNAKGDKVTEEHQYFNKLPLHTKSNYTAAELDKFLNDSFPFYGQTRFEKTWDKSPLAGSGKFFKEMEQEYKINALYLMAHAIHESAWGTSKIAQDKNNLFGYGAVDSDPYRGAYTYASFRESIEDAAKRVNTNYHSIDGFAYNGSFLGSKALGMNVRYASDPYWGEKIAGHMYRADTFLGKKDFNKQTLGYTNEPKLNFRLSAPSGSILYNLIPANIPVVIQGENTVSGALWYTVQSEDKTLDQAYVYGKGSLGEYVKQLPIAK